MDNTVRQLRTQNITLLLIATLAMAFSAHARADNYDNEWENVKANNNSANDETKNTNAEVESRELSREQNKEAGQMEESRQASNKEVRRFHEVLDELLAEFGYDVRMGQLNGLKNLAIRRVEVSDALPNTYRTYTEMLVAERLRENSKIRLISCIPCRGKTSQLVEGKLLITSPSTNIDRMHQAAEQLGIDNFMDVILVYHTTHMVLALQIFNAQSEETVWTRTYNSETIKSRFQKLAVDYQQVEKSRPGEDYVPEYRFLFGLGGGIVPNINADNKDNGMLMLGLRGTERFDNRHHEFGLQFNMYARKNAIMQEHDTKDDGSGDSSGDTAALASDDKKTQSDLTPWDYAIAMYGLYGRHFVGSLESYNDIRHGLNAGIGFLAAQAYATASVRLGWDIFFGKRFATNFGLVWLAPSTVVTSTENVKTKGGVGLDFTISCNF